MSPNRVESLREMIGEYEEDRSVTLSRLEAHRQRRTRLELARQVLLEHGEGAEAERLIPEISDLDQHIRSSQELVTKLDRLLAIFHTSLEKAEESVRRD